MDNPSATPAEPTRVMSMGARLTNIMAAPGEVFDAIKSSPTRAVDWLVPVLLSCLFAVVNVCVIFSQPAVLQQVKEKQEQQVQRMVAEGTITADKADQVREQIDRFAGPAVLKIGGSISSFIMVFGITFLMGLAIWLVGTKAWKSNLVFMKAVEVVSLSGIIGIVGGVVTMLLVVAKGNAMVNAGPALFLETIDPTNKMHLLLVSLNLSTLWYLAVLALGVARVNNVSCLKSIVWVYGVWAVLRAIIIVSGMGASGM